jgi:site-specific DNA-methyltransferase (adenine-specific)
LDEDAAAALDESMGELTSGLMRSTQKRVASIGAGGGYGGGWGPDATSTGTYGDKGGASRFFYVAKPARSERDRGCRFIEKKSAGEMTDREEGSAGLNSPRAGAGRTSGAKNIHPTVKSIDLMRWLCRLITPPNGVILDPFTGSGTTGVAALEEGFQFFGIEKEAEYFEIAKARIAAAMPYRPELF